MRMELNIFCDFLIFSLFFSGIDCLNLLSSFTDTRTDNPELSLSPDLLQGDILPQLVGRNAITSKIWPRGRIPYKFTSSYTQTEKRNVLQGMKEIEQETCVKFTPRQVHEANFLLIDKIPNEKCYATPGYTPGAKHTVNFGASLCLNDFGLIQHELLHVLGLLHEQSRPDRDNYVEVLKDNIEKGQEHNFINSSGLLAKTFGIGYDEFSLMHYTFDAFSIKEGVPTMKSKRGLDNLMGKNRCRATNCDLEKIRIMYKCYTHSQNDHNCINNTCYPKNCFINNYRNNNCYTRFIENELGTFIAIVKDFAFSILKYTSKFKSFFWLN